MSRARGRGRPGLPPGGVRFKPVLREGQVQSKPFPRRRPGPSQRHMTSDSWPVCPHSLTETIEGLQANIDHLQSQVDELKASGQRRSQGSCDQKCAPSLSCLKELYDLRQ